MAPSSDLVLIIIPPKIYNKPLKLKLFLELYMSKDKSTLSLAIKMYKNSNCYTILMQQPVIFFAHHFFSTVFVLYQSTYKSLI